MVTTDEPASVKLLKPSDTMDMEFARIPTTIFPMDNKMFKIIPVTVESMAYLPRTSNFFTSS